jgi:hypothetical protein
MVITDNFLSSQHSVIVDNALSPMAQSCRYYLIINDDIWGGVVTDNISSVTPRWSRFIHYLRQLLILLDISDDTEVVADKLS